MWSKISLSIQNHNYQYTQRKHNHDISSVETISIQSCPIYKKNGSIGGSTVLIKLEEIDWL